MPALTLAALAEKLDARLEGDGGVEITGVGSPGEAGPGEVTFLVSPKYRREVASSRAAAVIASHSEDVGGKRALRVDNPYLAFARALELFHPPRMPKPGVHPTAVCGDGSAIDPTASIGPLCAIAPGATVGPRSILGPHCIVGEGAVVGSDVLLHPRVTVGDRVRIGSRVIIHSGAVIGSDGFGYATDGGRHHKIPQVGTVEIGDDVEIGANVTVDRATLGATRIGEGTKIDNLVQIAHNVEVGRHSVIVALVGISGSTRVGNGVLLGGQVGIAGHLDIGDGSRIGAQSGVLADVPPGETRSGIGPIPHRQWLRAQAAFDRLPEIRKKVKELDGKVEKLAGLITPPLSRE